MMVAVALSTAPKYTFSRSLSHRTFSFFFAHRIASHKFVKYISFYVWSSIFAFHFSFVFSHFNFNLLRVALLWCTTDYATRFDDMVYIIFDDTFSSAVLLNWIRWVLSELHACKCGIKPQRTSLHILTHTRRRGFSIFLPTKSKNNFFVVCWTFWMWLKRGFCIAKRVM